MKEGNPMEYGLQLYSVRDAVAENMDDALWSVREIGYRYVEFAGFFGHPAESVREMLERHSLSVSGTHTPLRELTDDFDGTVRFHKAIGNANIILPMEDLSSQAKLDAFTETVNALKPRLTEHGIRFGYHNHMHEFYRNPDGSDIFGQIVDRTSLLLEIDVGWAFSGGQDPLKLMDRLKDRLMFIHIRDSVPNDQPVGDGQVDMGRLYDALSRNPLGRPLGQGSVPIGQVYEKAVALGLPMVVECETLQPDGFTSAAICFEYLKKLEEKNGSSTDWWTKI